MYKILGTANDHTSCDCCGRKGLKRTVALEKGADPTTTEVVHYGVTCAGRAMGKAKRDVEIEVSRIYWEKKREANEAERRRYYGLA